MKFLCNDPQEAEIISWEMASHTDFQLATSYWLSHFLRVNISKGRVLCLHSTKKNSIIECSSVCELKPFCLSLQFNNRTIAINYILDDTNLLLN